jgi:hypothetical protein
VLRRARQNPEKYPWLTQLLARRPFKVVAIALANKMARVAWALLGPAAKRLHSKAGYMAAPERFAKKSDSFPLHRGRRPYMALNVSTDASWLGPHLSELRTPSTRSEPFSPGHVARLLASCEIALPLWPWLKRAKSLDRHAGDHVGRARCITQTARTLPALLAHGRA